LSTEAFSSLLTQNEPTLRHADLPRAADGLAAAMAMALDEYDFIKLVDDEPAF
jgi:hypothetical protein